MSVWEIVRHRLAQDKAADKCTCTDCVAASAVAALGLDDFDAAVERIAVELHRDYDAEMAGTTPADFLDQARRILAAALTLEERP